MSSWAKLLGRAQQDASKPQRGHRALGQVGLRPASPQQGGASEARRCWAHKPSEDLVAGGLCSPATWAA